MKDFETIDLATLNGVSGGGLRDLWNKGKKLANDVVDGAKEVVNTVTEKVKDAIHELPKVLPQLPRLPGLPPFTIPLGPFNPQPKKDGAS